MSAPRHLSGRRWSPETRAAVGDRLRAGDDNTAIAAALGVSRPSVAKERSRLGLPPIAGRWGEKPHVPRGPSAQRIALEPELQRLYGQKLSDPAIATALGCGAQLVFCWRRKAGLPAVGVGGRPTILKAPPLRLRVPAAPQPVFREPRQPLITGAREARVRRLYESGAGDVAIGQRIGCSPGTVATWRAQEGLASNARRIFVRPLATSNALYAEALRVAQTASRDAAEDLAGELVLAVLEGLIARPTRDAALHLRRRYRSAGWFSLDERLHDDGAATRGDRLIDEAAIGAFELADEQIERWRGWERAA